MPAPREDVASTDAERSVIRRNNVRISGVEGGRPLVFAHGFGCSQAVWSVVAPAFEAEFQVVLFDLVGSGGSDLEAYDRSKYDSLDGYASDLLELLEALHLRDAVFVGHSVGAMIGVIAAGREPSPFGELVLISPSPRYVDTPGYVGGFDAEHSAALLDSLDANSLGWTETLSPRMMGNADRPHLSAELADSFCQLEPTIARHFARVTFLSDNRADLAQVITPTLILQSADDVIAPLEVGRYVHDAIPGSTYVELRATGHLPHLSAPHEVISTIRTHLVEAQ